MNPLFRIMAAAAIIGATVLAGCSNGSDPVSSLVSDSASDSVDSSVAEYVVSGTAAVGAPIDGIVYIKDAEGTEVYIATDSEGKFTIDVDGMLAPFIIKVEPNDDGDTLYSFASAEGIANATSLTNFALYLASDKADLGEIYDNWDGTSIDAMELAIVQATINKNLASEMESQGLDPDTYDFVKEPFDANSSGIDAVLDSIDVVVDLVMGDYTFQVIDDAAFVFDENINPAGEYIGDPIDWPNGGEAAYPVVASMVIEGASATYTVVDDNSFIYGTPYYDSERQQQAVMLYTTLDESGVLTLTADNDVLTLTDPIIYKEMPNRVIWKDSTSGYWVVGIATPTTDGVVIIAFDVTTAAHVDEEEFYTQGIIEFDVFPLS